jgi:hypothetical protein
MAKSITKSKAVNKQQILAAGKLLKDIATLSGTGKYDAQWTKQVLHAASSLHYLLTSATGSLGECRRQVPYAKVRPVIEPDGTLRWCCEHNPEHCA